MDARPVKLIPALRATLDDADLSARWRDGESLPADLLDDAPGAVDWSAEGTLAETITWLARNK